MFVINFVNSDSSRLINLGDNRGGGGALYIGPGGDFGA